MGMTKEVAARMLDGHEYGDTDAKFKGLFAQMKTDRLVAIFGYSDDLMEWRGFENDEGSTNQLWTSQGRFQTSCENEIDCPHEQKLARDAIEVEAQWDLPGQPAWTYKTEIPHATFNVMEDEEVFCRGIVFSLDDIAVMEGRKDPDPSGISKTAPRLVPNDYAIAIAEDAYLTSWNDARKFYLEHGHNTDPVVEARRGWDNYEPPEHIKDLTS